MNIYNALFKTPGMAETLTENVFFIQNEYYVASALDGPLKCSKIFINYIQIRFFIGSLNYHREHIKDNFKYLNDDVIDDFYIQLKAFNKEIATKINILLSKKEDIIELIQKNNTFKIKLEKEDINIDLLFASFFDYIFCTQFKKYFLFNQNLSTSYLKLFIQSLEGALDNLINNAGINPLDYLGVASTSSLKGKKNIKNKYTLFNVESIFSERKLAVLIYKVFMDTKKSITLKNFINLRKEFDLFFNDNSNSFAFNKLSVLYSNRVIQNTSKRSRRLFLHQLFEICEIEVVFDDELEKRYDKKNSIATEHIMKKKERRIATLVPDLK